MHRSINKRLIGRNHFSWAGYRPAEPEHGKQAKSVCGAGHRSGDAKQAAISGNGMEETGMEILRCEGVRKVYGTGNSQVVALNKVELSVEKGEFVAIVGASGSGKSTLLHILGSVDRPTEGRVIIEGTDISTLNQKRAAIFRRRKVGLVYQFYNLIPTLTVRKNILMPLLLDKKKPNQEYFEQVVRALGIADKMESLPNQLSGGQQQRAAIARSLIYRPALLLADEPTGNLDQKNSREIIDMLKLSNRNLNQTILLITHDEKIALEADRIVVIEDGQIVSDGKKGGKALS